MKTFARTVLVLSLVGLAAGTLSSQPAPTRMVTEAQYELLRERLLGEVDPQRDSLRLYRLAMPKEQFRECFGVQREIDFDGPLVV